MLVNANATDFEKQFLPTGSIQQQQKESLNRKTP